MSGFFGINSKHDICFFYCEWHQLLKWIQMSNTFKGFTIHPEVWHPFPPRLYWQDLLKKHDSSITKISSFCSNLTWPSKWGKTTSHQKKTNKVDYFQSKVSHWFLFCKFFSTWEEKTAFPLCNWCIKLMAQSFWYLNIGSQRTRRNQKQGINISTIQIGQRSKISLTYIKFYQLRIWVQVLF